MHSSPISKVITLDGKEANHRCRLGCSKIDCPNIDDSDLTDGATLEGFLEEKKETCTSFILVPMSVPAEIENNLKFPLWTIWSCFKALFSANSKKLFSNSW